MNYYTRVIETKETSLKKLTDTFPPICIQYLITKAQTKNVNTVESYAEDIDTFLHFLQRKKNFCSNKPLKSATGEEFAHVTQQDILDYLEFLKEYQNRDGKPRKNGYASQRHKLAVVRGFFTFLKKEGYIEVNPSKEITAAKPIENQAKISQTDIRTDVTTNKQILSLILKDDLFTGKREDIHKQVACRDYIIIDLYTNYKLPAYEIAGLDLEDLNLDNNTLTVTDYHGNRRTNNLDPELQSMLATYISKDPDKKGTRCGLHPQDNEKALFVSREKGRISSRSILNTYNKYKKLLFERSGRQ